MLFGDARRRTLVRVLAVTNTSSRLTAIGTTRERASVLQVLGGTICSRVTVATNQQVARSTLSRFGLFFSG